jgi:hypothetical protein
MYTPGGAVAEQLPLQLFLIEWRPHDLLTTTDVCILYAYVCDCVCVCMRVCFFVTGCTSNSKTNGGMAASEKLCNVQWGERWWELV